MKLVAGLRLFTLELPSRCQGLSRLQHPGIHCYHWNIHQSPDIVLRIDLQCQEICGIVWSNLREYLSAEPRNYKIGPSIPMMCQTSAPMSCNLFRKLMISTDKCRNWIKQYSIEVLNRESNGHSKNRQVPSKSGYDTISLESSLRNMHNETPR